MNYPYKIYPIGDSALTIDFGNVIDEALNDWVRQLFIICYQQPFDGFIEAVPAYSSLSIFYRVSAKTNFKTVRVYLEDMVQLLLTNKIAGEQKNEQKTVEIPVKYNGEDLAYVANYHQLTVEEVIHLHTSAIYRVFMMGFLPGFAYLGVINEKIATPRRSSPRLKVPAGSVGIAGKQTGIYPLESPGGWQLIGQTKVKLFDPTSVNPVLLQAGDKVKFVQI